MLLMTQMAINLQLYSHTQVVHNLTGKKVYMKKKYEPKKILNLFQLKPYQLVCLHQETTPIPVFTVDCSSLVH